ncbi:MAG: hypothetical protein RIA69_12750 [Cyclobacteriaceae bacterium]
MKGAFFIIVIICNCWSLFGQSDGTYDTQPYRKIIRHFENRWDFLQEGRILRGLPIDSSSKPSNSSLYKTKSFNLSLSEHPVKFDTSHFVLSNPNFTDDFDGDNYINYPVSFSGIYEDKLISLFTNGKFLCHNLQSIERDIHFEQRLNTKKFEYHWIIDSHLYALSGNRIFRWDNQNWVKSELNISLNDQRIIFADQEFIVFGDCHGEWGGTVYFFDRASGETHFTESSCTNSVLKKDGKYIVLAHLGHMNGSSEVKWIDDPRKLPRANKHEINKKKEGQTLGYLDNSGVCQKQLDIHGIVLISTFNYDQRELYIAHLAEFTFAAEINGTDIQIVHPLFGNKLYAYSPITRNYENFTLINLDQYGTAHDKEVEVAVIIIKEDAILKLDWNENQSHPR